MRARSLEPLQTLSVAVALLASVMLVSLDMSARWSAVPLGGGADLARAVEQAPPLPPRVAASSPAPLSLVGVNFPIETASGSSTSFAATAGQVRLVTLFYSHCPGLCPMTIATLQRLESELAPAERARLRAVLLSLDPEHDTPAQLRSLQNERHIDSGRWLLGRTAPADLRMLTRKLGVRVQALPNGMLDHTPLLLLIDAQGRVLASTHEVSRTDGRFLAAVRASVAAHS